MENLALYSMAGIYILAGIMHFITPKPFLSITPKWVPFPVFINYWVGSIEVLLGILLCFPDTQSWAAWGIITLLVAVFPANIYHFQKARRKGKMVAVTMVRLPIQALLIYWAWLYT